MVTRCRAHRTLEAVEWSSDFVWSVCWSVCVFSTCVATSTLQAVWQGLDLVGEAPRHGSVHLSIMRLSLLCGLAVRESGDSKLLKHLDKSDFLCSALRGMLFSLSKSFLVAPSHSKSLPERNSVFLALCCP